jgi:hypothetical protein
MAAFIGFLIFSSLVLFIVSSSSSIHEAVAASLNSFIVAICASGPFRRLARPVVAVCPSSATLVLPFRFQLPPPTLWR